MIKDKTKIRTFIPVPRPKRPRRCN